MANSFLNRKQQQENGHAKDQFLAIRQWLNIIFMVCAIVGVVLYVTHTPQTLGIIVVLMAMVFKIVECALRFIK